MAKAPTPAAESEATITPMLITRLEALEASVSEIKAILAKHTETLAAETARLIDGEITAPAGYDPRGELLKAFRQIEAIAGHINVRLPA